MEILTYVAAFWIATGLIKSLIWIQQIPMLMGWWVFYSLGNHEGQGPKEEQVHWRRYPGMTVRAVWIAFTFTIMFVVLGPLRLFAEGLNFFKPYSDPYIAGFAAVNNNIDIGVKPGRFESWDAYMTRMGDDPKAVANSIDGMPLDQLPPEVKNIVEVARDLKDMQHRDVPELDEDEEFRDK